MPRSIADIGVLQQYIRGVLERAEHHAANVDEVLFAVAGAVVWRKDDEHLEVMLRDGDMKNVLWVHVDGTRYAIAYDHVTQAIQVRRGSTHGPVLASFTNATPHRGIKAFFAGL